MHDDLEKQSRHLNQMNTVVENSRKRKLEVQPDLKVIYTYRPFEDSLDFEDAKETFRLKPLKGKLFLENFAGDPKEGGASLSTG